MIFGPEHLKWLVPNKSVHLTSVSVFRGKSSQLTSACSLILTTFTRHLNWLLSWKRWKPEEKLSYLCRGLDALDHGQRDNGPSSQQTAGHDGVQLSGVVDGVCDVQGFPEPEVRRRGAGRTFFHCRWRTRPRSLWPLSVFYVTSFCWIPAFREYLCC